MHDDELDFALMSAYQLIEQLDKAFPHQCILPNEPEWKAHRYAGKRELIDELMTAKAAEIANRD